MSYLPNLSTHNSKDSKEQHIFLKIVFFILVFLIAMLVMGASQGYGQNAQVYYTDADNGEIWRAQLDGTAPERIQKWWAIKPVDIELDLTSGKMYWTDNVGFAGQGRSMVRRANLDGTEVEELVPVVEPGAMVLDLDAGKMYWVAFGQTLYEANLDGSDAERIYTDQIADLALHPVDSYLYWTTPTSIRRGM